MKIDFNKEPQKIKGIRKSSLKKDLYNFISHPEIRKKIIDERFELSQELISYRLKLGYTLEGMAQIVGYEPDYYLKFEYGDLDIPKVKYILVMYKIECYMEDNQ